MDNFKKKFLFLISSYAGFTYLNPKVFELINNNHKWFKKCFCLEQKHIFIIFSSQFILLPIILFFILILIRKEKLAGLIQKGQYKLTTLSLIGVTIIILISCNITFFNTKNNSNSIDNSFNKLQDYTSTTKTYKKSEEVIFKIDSLCLVSDIDILTKNKRDHQREEFNIKICSEPDSLFSNLTKIKENLILERASYTKTDLNIIKSLTKKLTRHFELNYLAAKAKNTKDQFIITLKKIRNLYLIEISLLIIVLMGLYLVYNKQKRLNSTEGYIVSSLLYLYILIGIQIIGVQSFDYINIDKTGFQYRVASWYSPAFIAHSVDQITKFETNNNTSNHYNPNVDKKLTEELIIKNLQLDTTQFKIDISTRLLNKNIVEIVKLEIENRDSTFENILNSFNQYLMKANELNLEAIEQLNTINTKIDRNNTIITNLGNHIKTGGTNAE